MKLCDIKMTSEVLLCLMRVACEQHGGLARIFYPGNMDNILSACNLPGWKEGLTKRLAVIFDPHNIAQEIFKYVQNQVVLHYIECIQDLEPVKMTLTSAAAAAQSGGGDGGSDENQQIVLLNFGGGTNLMVRQIKVVVPVYFLHSEF